MLYKKYIWQLYWFPPKSPRNSFSYSHWTKQDRYFDKHVDTADYIIFYNRFNRIKWEGPIQDGSIQGTVKYYYNNGKLKRIEQFGYEKDTYWESEYNWSDAPYEKGNWKYYKRTGRLFKERQYLTLKSVDGQHLYRLCNISYLDKKNKVYRTKSILLESR